VVHGRAYLDPAVPGKDADDLDDLLEVVGVLAGAEGAIEVRAAVGGADGPTT
jgi:hypothetical protein